MWSLVLRSWKNLPSVREEAVRVNSPLPQLHINVRLQFIIVPRAAGGVWRWLGGYFRVDTCLCLLFDNSKQTDCKLSSPFFFFRRWWVERLNGEIRCVRWWAQSRLRSSWNYGNSANLEKRLSCKQVRWKKKIFFSSHYERSRSN